MSDEPTIYTPEELNGLTRVQLRQLAVNTYGMDNTKCAKTKAKALKEWILEQQEKGAGGNSEGKKASSGKKASGGKGGKSRPSSGGRRGRPSASSAAPPKSGGRRTRTRKPAETEPEPPHEDEGGEEGSEEAAAVAEVDLGAVEERLDALGKAVDEHDEEVRPQINELAETVADIQRNQFIQFGLLCDIRTALYGEEDDLEARLDQLEAEWDEGQNDQGEE